MKKVTRDELLDFQTYSDRREEIRGETMKIKVLRRIHIGKYLTFLFENADTIRYQIQEIMRAERIARESDIEHEIAVYNDMLGDEGELGGVLLIEIDDPQVRKEKLREWMGLQEHVYLKLEDGSRAAAQFDPSQVGEDRVSSVQYLKFSVGDKAPVAIGCDFPGLEDEVEFSGETREALLADLGS